MPSALSPAALRKLDELASSEASPKAVAAVRRIVTEGSDLDGYKINVFRVADESGLTRQETLRAFLFATRIGVMDLTWDIHCPACKGVPAYEKHLMGLRDRAHCGLCNIDWDLNLEDQVEVTFTVHPEIRRIDYADFKDRDFDSQMQYFADIEPREGREFAAADCILGGKTVTIAADFKLGEYWFYVPSHLDGWGTLRVSGEPTSEPQRVEIRVDADARTDVHELALRPGEIQFVVTSQWPGINALLVRLKAPEKNWVSAAHVTSQQDFRDLFSGEFLAPDVSFAIRSVTLMFTDIRGSTELYESLGDAKAYALVQEHFRIMSGFIRKFEGGIVKTIGDAVMAAFPVNVNAVRAAHGIQSEFRRRAAEIGGIEVKIGLHRGPAIAVTSNRSLDYFGRTANIAARVEKTASSGDLVMSEAVVRDEAVEAYWRSWKTRPEEFEAQLKGVAGGVRLFRVAARP